MKLKSLSAEQQDDELIREHLLSLLKLWVFRCFDHVRSIDQEIEILETMARMKRADVARQPEVAPPPSRPPMKPIVITRESLKVCKKNLDAADSCFGLVVQCSAALGGAITPQK